MSAPLETGGPPPDAVIVAALRAGDMTALGAAYDRYGSALHTFAYSMVRSRDRAADVTHDSFMIAAARIDQLRDPTRLRPWLYAIVRSECLRDLRGTKRETAFEEWHDRATDDAPDDDLHRREVQELVRSALDGLSPKDREVIELSLRHDLDNGEIAAVLGVKASHVTALTSRSRKALERSLGTLLVARAGGEGCDELTALLAPWDGVFTPLWRKRIAKHVDGCPTCTGERRKRFTPAAILVALPMMAVPVALRDRVISDAHPVLTAYTQNAGEAHAAEFVPEPVTMSGQTAGATAGPPTSTMIDGQPAWDYPPAERAGPRWWMWVTAAVMAMLVAGGLLAALVVRGSDDPDPTPVVDDSQTVEPAPQTTAGIRSVAPPPLEREVPTTSVFERSPVTPAVPPELSAPVEPSPPVPSASAQPSGAVRPPAAPVSPAPDDSVPPAPVPGVPDPAAPVVPPAPDPGMSNCPPAACGPSTDPAGPQID